MTVKPHRMQLPREVFVGNDTLGCIGEVCRELGFSESALLITGSKTFRIAGEKVIDLLEGANLEVNYLIIDTQTPTLDDVNVIEKRIEKDRPDVVLGVGGGAKIDLAKLSSAHREVPFISVPTTASHDGMASPIASLKGLERPYSVVAQSPIAVIADTSIIINAPSRLLVSGCGDIIAKFTATRDWELAHIRNGEYFAQYASSLALMSARHLADNVDVIRPRSEEGLRIVLEALVSCGVSMGIAGSSRPCSGSEHLFSKALDLIAEKPALHGEECGLGSVMMAYLHNVDWVGIKNLLKKVGAPTTSEEIGIEPEFIIEALVHAPEVRPERYTILHEKRLTHETAEELAKVTGIIE